MKDRRNCRCCIKRDPYQCKNGQGCREECGTDGSKGGGSSFTDTSPVEGAGRDRWKDVGGAGVSGWKDLSETRFPPSGRGSWELVAPGTCLEKVSVGWKSVQREMLRVFGLASRRDRNPTVKKCVPEGRVSIWGKR